MIFNIQRFYRTKALVFIFLHYAAGALLGMILVFLSHGNYTVMAFVAVLFLAGPLASAYCLKNRFLQPVSVEINESFLKITEEDQDGLVLPWATVASYQVEITRAFFNSGYLLRLTHHNGFKTRFILIEPLFVGANINKDSALYALCRSIKRFNRSATQPVALRPSLAASRTGTLIATLIGVLALITVSLFLLKGSRLNSKRVSGLTIVVMILTAGLAARKKQSDALYRQLQEVHEK